MPEHASQTRTIAGYPCSLREIRLPPLAAASGARTHSVRLWVVDRIDEIVDGQALLRNDDGVEPPYWALLWIGARAIASAVATDPPATDRRVLDLGCGLGLSGVAAGVAGAEVWFADYVPECLEFAAASAAANQLTNYRTQVTDFTRDKLDGTFDLILAADIVYDPAHYAPLADFLVQHLAPGGAILLTESLRADAKRFLAMMVERGFNDDRQATWIEEDGRPERTWLHRLSIRPARD